MVEHGYIMAKRRPGPRYATAWEHFAPVAERTIRIERITNGAKLVRLYQALLAGEADPAAGCVVCLSG